MEERIANIERKIVEIENTINKNTKFNLLGEEVVHKKYGKGTVINQDENTLKINFEKDVVKSFSIDALVYKKLLKATNNKLQEQIDYIDELNIKRKDYEKQKEEVKKEKQIQDTKIERKESKEKLFRKLQTEKLIKIICKEIESYLNRYNGLDFYAKPVEGSCIQVSKKGWENEHAKGIHYEVCSKNICKGDLFGCKNSEVKIALHIEGKNMDKVVSELEKLGVYKSHHKVIEEEIINLDFLTGDAIKESIKTILIKLKQLDLKYTSKIEEAIKKVKSK